MPWGFERGHIYNRRRDIHGRFKGQERGGIATPAGYPIVFIFTGLGGLDHGYSDRWRPDGVFEYFGEGQKGDMKLSKGNLAIAEHAVRGKSLLLFNLLANTIQFEDEMVFENYHIERAPDSHGDMRDAIVFELRRLEEVVDATESALPAFPPAASLDDLRLAAMAAAKAAPSSKMTSATVYERSRKVRDYVLARCGGKCEHCRKDAPFLRSNGSPYLEPHHIRRLSDGGPDDPRFVIALCPNCHREAHFGDAVGLRQTHLAKMKAIEVL